VEASSVERRGYLDLARLTPAEFAGCACGIVLVLSLFLPWFATSESNSNSVLAGASGGDSVNAWETFGVLDYLLVAAASAPFILAWIVARGHKLTWKPGEVTMIVAITGLVLILCNGIILGRPGDSVEISLQMGYGVGLLACFGMAVSGFLRQALYTEGRKPPGTI
jgi:hypothetical protein